MKEGTFPRKMTPARRARLLKTPHWYEATTPYGWSEPCMGCGRRLERGDVIQCVWGATLKKMRRRGACCEPYPKPVIALPEVEQLSVIDLMRGKVPKRLPPPEETQQGTGFFR